jgi:lipopolysaccharide transport system permease protein
MKKTTFTLNMEEFIIQNTGKFTFGWRELWQYRELFYFFTWRDVKVRYKQAVLGILWVMLQPLSMMLVFSFVLSKTFKADTDGLPYPVFVFSGLILWQLFSSGLSNAANSMVSNANIIKKIYFPRLIIPLSSILTAFFDFLFAFIAFIFLLIYHQTAVSIWKVFLYIPLSILLVVLTTFGLGTLIASLNVKYRDFQYVIPFLIQFLFFLNPIVYPAKVFDLPILNIFMKINPIAGAMRLMRGIFTEGVIPFSDIAIWLVVAFVLALIGIYAFRKMEAYFADLA